MALDTRREFLLLAGGGIAGAAVHAGAQRTAAASPSSPLGEFNVRAFGAKGDGTTLDTKSINKAIAEVSAAGGGTLNFPAGNYLSHSIHLKSKVSLYLDQGATIVAADATDNHGPCYDLAEPNQWDHYQDFGHSHWRNSLIWGDGLENIAILGPGMIWGKGLSRGWTTELQAETPGVGNKAISLKNCRNVILRDFSILHGGHFGILATGVDNFTIDNLIIDTNRDGMDIDCCRNVRVSNCSVNSPWDDGICLKSSFGLGYARATEMVTITNCFVTGGYQEGTLLDATMKRFAPGEKVSQIGRIKFGTESNGGFKNITISNCVFDSCRGLALETVDGALLEDVTITNITMRDIVNAPIFFRLGSRMRGPQGIPVGALRRVIVDNVVCSNSASQFGCILSGIPGHEIENVKFSNIFIQHKGGGTQTAEPAEKENSYPEPDMFGNMPSHGFYIRHVKGIEMTNVEIAYLEEDSRPVFYLSDVKDIDFLRIKAQHAALAPIFSLNRVDDFNLYLSRPLQDIHIDRADQRNL